MNRGSIRQKDCRKGFLPVTLMVNNIFSKAIIHVSVEPFSFAIRFWMKRAGLQVHDSQSFGDEGD